MNRNIAYKDFSGGLNTTDNPFQLQPNELQQCDNFTVNKKGYLSLRKGFMQVTIGGGSPTGLAITGLWRCYNTQGYGTLLGAALHALFKVDDITGALTDYPYYSTGRAVSGVQMKGRLYVFSQGKMSEWWSDGFQVFQPMYQIVNKRATPVAWSSYAPTNGTNSVDLTFARYYYMSFYNNNGEGSPNAFGTAGAQLDASRHFYHVDLDGLDTHDGAGYLGRRLYRGVYANGVRGQPRLVFDFADLATVTYEDNIPDSMLGGDMPVMEIPDGEGCACEFDNRIFRVWGKATSEIRWTRQNEPYSWPVANSLMVAPTGVHRITALIPLSGRLLAFTPNRIYAVYGDFDEDNPNYAVSLVGTELGCLSPKTIATDGDVVYFLSKANVWRYDGNLTCVSTKIHKSLKGLPTLTAGDAAGLVYDRKYWLCVSELDYTQWYANPYQNDATYVLDLLALEEGREVWTRFDYGYNCLVGCPNDTAFENLVGPIMGGYPSGAVDRLDYGQTDLRGAIEGVIKTAPFDAGMPADRKLFRKVWPWVNGTMGDLALQVRADYGAATQVHTTALAGNAARPLPILMVNQDTIAGNVLEAIITYNQLSYAIDILAMELEVAPRPHRAI